MWKRPESGAKGSDVIHALMRCLYMQLIWIQFAPCVHNGHTIVHTQMELLLFAFVAGHKSFLLNERPRSSRT